MISHQPFLHASFPKPTIFLKMRTTYTSRSERNSKNPTRSRCESSSSDDDDDSRTTMDNNSSFSDSEDFPIIRSPAKEYFDDQIDPAGLKAEYDSLVQRLGSKWTGVRSVASLDHCYGQQEAHRIMMTDGNNVMEALRKLISENCEVLKDKIIDFTALIKKKEHALHQPAISSLKQALTKIVVTEGHNLTLKAPNMNAIYEAALPFFGENIKDYNFKLDPNCKYELPKKKAGGGNDAANKFLLEMRHDLIVDRFKDDLKNKEKLYEKEILDLQRKINKLKVEKKDLTRKLDKNELWEAAQREEEKSKANMNTELNSLRDDVSKLKLENDQVNESLRADNKRLRLRIKELESQQGANLASTIENSTIHVYCTPSGKGKTEDLE